MTFKVFIRLFLSALIAFVSYASWAYYANSLVTNDPDVLLKSALVQGFYSGGITLFFTVLLEVFYKKFGSSVYCLPFIVPRINAKPSLKTKCATLETFEASLVFSEKKCKGACLPGELISPLPALLIQTIMVIGVNVAFSTPNLWLTVAPSIVFSAIYGYTYSIALARKNAINV
ncbi:MAG: hypothetical protein ACJAVV_001340 [Alphaproteobacteria bacterium]|jgi:hypothetical protein